MGYGRGEYGQRGYGGSSFETGGPSLVTSVPLNGAIDVPVTDPISLTIQSAAGLDEFSLSVDIEGEQAIVGGVFQSGYSGTIVYDPETDVIITISTHPLFAGGSTTVDFAIDDLAGESFSSSIMFTAIDNAVVSETLTLTEGLTASLSFNEVVAEGLTLTEAVAPAAGYPVGVGESFQIDEGIQTGSFLVEALDASTIRATFPFELRFTGTADLSNFSVKAEPGSDPPGFPVRLVDVDPGFTTYASGSNFRVVDTLFARIFYIGLNYVRGASGTESNVISVTDNVPDSAFSSANVGDYIEILNGQGAGIYQIINRTLTDSFLDAALPREFRLLLDRPLPIKDPTNGYVEGKAEVVSITAGNHFTLRLDLPAITPDDPIVEVVRIQNRTKGWVFDLPEYLGRETSGGKTPLILNKLNHNTFEYHDSTNRWPDRVVEEGDRVVVLIRTVGKIEWRHISGVESLTFRTNKSPGTKLTGGSSYLFSGKNLLTKLTGQDVRFDGKFIVLEDVVEKPRVLSAEFTEEGNIILRFNQAMLVDDENFVNREDYTITGPTTVSVRRVFPLSDSAVVLETAGIREGTYTVTVSTSTPKDVAGNPLDPIFNTAIFTAATPLSPRSLFTDKGPIAKPELSVQTGTGASLDSVKGAVTLPGATLTSDEVGLRLRLTGGSLNGGDFLITSASGTAAVVKESWNLPDPDSGSLDWEVFDPRNGQVADDPSDVVVRINGSPVTPEAVVGLLGQIVLDSVPDPADTVEVDYSWTCNPNIEFRRLNSREFRLNSWNRDLGYARDSTQHKYRYNNTLVTPAVYEALNPTAKLEQPLSRELHYRGYERAYTAVLNDPTLLLLNSPIHKIAFPPAQRFLTESFITYEGIGLPEAQVANAWERVGAGTVSAVAGVLTVQDDVTGAFPTGQPVFWTREIDITFDHVFAQSWRFSLDTVTTTEGVFTGIAAGFSDELIAAIVGYIDDGGTKKIGLLKRGSTDDPSVVASWTGGIDGLGASTGAPVELDWSILRSYRVFRGLNGVIQVFVDGDLEPILQATSDELPFLEELNAPFDAIQGVFFGSLSRPAESTSSWDFVRYLIQPATFVQSSPSSFVSFEANVLPEVDSKPWTPIGFHGTETIISNDFLYLDSTSATDTDTADEVGLIGGDYRGFVRFEPLLSASAEVVFDVGVQMLTHTHGVSASSLMAAVDDGTRVMQLAFFPDFSTPKLSYGGRSLPEDFSPYTWTALGGETGEMKGRTLRVTDANAADGLVYFIEDTEPAGTDGRVIGSATDYILEARCQVLSYTADGSGFAGAFAQAFDGVRAVGFLLDEVAGTRRVSLHSDGVVLTSFNFEWNDGLAHTYRLSKSTGGDLVSLFIDGTFTGSLAYSSFTAPPPDPIGQVSFGSATPASVTSESVVDWSYCNAWRVRADQKRYIGLWNGGDTSTFLGYHMPLKTSGRGAQVAGNALGDPLADFLALGVVAGDALVVDVGPNAGVYEVAAVIDGQNLTIVGTWPLAPTLVDYRIVQETDWTTPAKYRIFRDSTGTVSILKDNDASPLIQVTYSSLELPSSGQGIIRTLSGGLPAVAFGSFEPEELSQSSWDYVRYGLTRSVNELRIAPHHQVLNQWNVMASPEHLFTSLVHDHTDFKSSSTGQPPKTDPDFLEDDDLVAFTVLNEDTPLVPLTQTFEVRGPYPVQETVSGLNRPEDVLNNDGDFTLNDGTLRFRLIVPDDVLYTCLDVIEQQDGGAIDLIAPFDDECGCLGGPHFSGFQVNKEVCLEYDGTALPESTISPTPWELVSDNPANVSASAFAGILTYATTAATRTVYRNNTPLPDAPSLQTEARFRLRLLNDGTGGVGDTQVRFGLSAPGLTVSLAFVTVAATQERFVLVIDQNTQAILGSATFDFLDGNYHDYRIVRDPSAGEVRVFIDA